MKKIIFLLLASIVLLCSCNKDVALVEEPDEDLETTNQELWVGVWKLIQAVPPAHFTWTLGEEAPPPFDYSNYNATFEFKADSVLIVKGKMNHPYWTIGLEETIFNIKEGTYTYFILEPKNEHWFYLEIDNKHIYDFVVHDKSMSIGLTGIGSLSFERVKE